LSSPSDVASERNAARAIIEHKARSHPFRNELTAQVIVYDDPDAPVPMAANETPQESVNRYAGRPADSDLTIVILWNRLGTPLPSSITRADGSRYASGTVWELEDALSANKDIWVYRRKPGSPSTDLDAERVRQRSAVQAFFASFTFPDGSIQRGRNDYAEPQEFAALLTAHLDAYFTERRGALREGPATDSGAARLLWNVPPLPAHYVERPELPALEHRLLAGATQARPLAIQGIGGLGKTVLAAALASREAVKRTFDDRVFFRTLGQKPELPTLQLELLAALGVSVPAPGFANALQDLHKRALSQVLAARACLIVLDDVWDARHVYDAFEVTGKSRLVLTARRRDVLLELNAELHAVEEFSNSDSLTLLAAHVDIERADLPAEAEEIVRECGGAALALAMVGSMLRGRPRDRWPNVLDTLQQGDLRQIRPRFPGSPHENLFKCMDLSMAALPVPLVERYRELAVFPEDASIPEAALRTYWAPRNLSARGVMETVDALVDHALLQRDAANALTLHDLQLDYLRSEADLGALHRELMATYRASAPGGLHTVIDDGYFYRHAAYHLREAEGPAALRALLLDLRWLAARLHAGGPEGLLADFDQLPLAHDRPLSWLRDALRLSAGALAARPGELASQLCGRLLDSAEPDLAALARAVIFPRFGGRFDYAAAAASSDRISNSKGLT
jgi:hypothetical protein